MAAALARNRRGYVVICMGNESDGANVREWLEGAGNRDRRVVE